MNKIAAAALKLAVKTLTEQYGWKDMKPAAPNTRRTAAKMKLLSGGCIKLKVKGDKLIASALASGYTVSLHECYIGDPRYDHKMSEIEVIVATDAERAYYYARYVLKGPFPAGEAAIATNAECAHYYARVVLKGPFPAGEAAIAKSAHWAHYYARVVLKGPFPAGEAAIAKSAHWAYYYALLRSCCVETV